MSKKLDDHVNNLPEDKKLLLSMRHTAEHILHTAVQNLYPGILKAMGPATEDGFYFDFDPGTEKFNADNFAAIEKEMGRIIKADLPLVQDFIDYDTARNIFKDNPYKLDWLDRIKNRGEKISIYRMGDMDLDLCSGPHAQSTGKVGPYKLLTVAGAYWHGDEKNKMLVRIYGTCFATREELDHYLWIQEEARKRDHRKLGKTLDLFTFSEYVGSGLPLFTQNGALIRRLITEYVESVQSEEDYMQVWTPQIAKAELFKISGHYDKYRENLFSVKSNYSDEEFFLKPMNCPQHTQIYASAQHSYRDLPIRMTDFAMLYRDEKPGELNGLARVRSFSQDDCHIFCREDQVDGEVDRALAMTKRIMQTFGFKYKYRLSTRDKSAPEKYVGNPAIWDRVEAWAVKIMERNGIEYFDGPGEAAFYAPKMDLIATDALGREWQLSTVQIDFHMPERFDLTYTDSDGTKKRPVMIHRAIVGSPERFMMVLLEHFAGALPTWLNPRQVAVLPIAERHLDYARKILSELKSAGIRAQLDERNESLKAKIRDAQISKVSYMLIVGDKEVADKTVTERGRSGKMDGPFPVAKFIENITSEIRAKTIT